jgi:hypothetical protein
MKLETFYASDGDCLLLSSEDGHHALIDGGRTPSFRENTWPRLEELAANDQLIDLLVVTHIDADHISGILWLMKQVAEWERYDYQTGVGANPTYPKPDFGRPPTVTKLWHNAWSAQLGDLAGPIEALTGRMSQAVGLQASTKTDLSVPAQRLLDAATGIAESIGQGYELRQLAELETSVDRNSPFEDLVLLRTPPHVEPLGSASLTVIGPSPKHLARLRQDWARWIEDVGESTDNLGTAAPGAAALGGGVGVPMSPDTAATLLTRIATAADIIEQSDPSKVTPPNRASLTLLVEEGDRLCLLTGDAADEELLDGLRAAKAIDQGVARVDLLKVQHHGSEYNLSRDFAEVVVADHYVFSADGNHKNPDPRVVRTIIEARRSCPDDFTLWFNCSPTRTTASRSDALQAAISEATDATSDCPHLRVEVLSDVEPSFTIEL